MKSWLKSLGVETIFCGAGNRNSSLLTEFADFKLIFGLDERSLAFEALGHAKLSKKPVVICTTSGTAVAECFPALIEAYYSDVPLIIISADRPSALKNTRAPQTINQSNIFGEYARSFFEVNFKKFIKPEQQVSFPLHLNILVDQEGLDENIVQRPGTEVLSQAGVAIFTEGSEDFIEEYKYLNNLNYPCYVEIHSGLKETGNIKYEKELLYFIENNSINYVIKFGKTPVTKFWRLLNSKYLDLGVFSYQSENHGCYGGIKLDSLKNITSYSQYEFVSSDFLALKDKFPMSEASMIFDYCQALTDEDLLYLGNSMPIRYGDFCRPVKCNILASRGANGIDGQISTAAGIARASKKTVHALIGDLTFLYDKTRLDWELPPNLKIIVINNFGGGIFKRVDSDKRMVLEHKLEIKTSDQITVLNPNEEQTSLFWKEWNHDSK